jgi:hypothetical protein
MDGLTDAGVSSAAADVGAHGGVDLGVGGMGRGGEESRSGEDLAGLAVAALGNVDLLPRELDGVGAVEGEAFDGGDGVGADVVEEGLAGAGRLRSCRCRSRIWCP